MDFSHAKLINFAGPLKETAAGNKCILLSAGKLFSWPVASTISTKCFSSRAVINFVVEKICQLYRDPIQILMDSDSK